MPRISALMVTYQEDAEAIRRAVRSLLAQRRRPDEVVIADNHPEGRMARALAGEPGVRVIPTRRNLGYPSGINVAAKAASGELFLCLNPDADAAPDCVEILADVLESCPDIAVAGAQVLLTDGETVNAGANPVHLSGLSWSGRYGERRESGPPRDVLAVSGAAGLIRASVFRELGGFCEGFFLYHDDVDLAWRSRIAGHRIVFCPDATVSHDYEFVKGRDKWLWLERNRLWCVLANYEGRTLLLLAPILIATEAAVIVFAWRSGWLAEKRRAYAFLWKARGALRRHRRFVQSRRRVPDAALLPEFKAAFETSLIPVELGPLNDAMQLYKRVVVSVLQRAQ